MSDSVTLAVEKEILQAEVRSLTSQVANMFENQRREGEAYKALHAEIGKLKADRSTHHAYFIAMRNALAAASKSADSIEADMAQCIAREPS